MYTNRKAVRLISIPFGVVTLATLLLFFLADQTQEALSGAMRFSDLWMEADRNGALQVERCLDFGGGDCDRLPDRLKRPLAYMRAVLERDKPDPDLQQMQDDLAEAGAENFSLLRFRLRWFEHLDEFVGLSANPPPTKVQQPASLKAPYTADIEQLMALNLRARQARERQPLDEPQIAAIRKDLNILRSGLESSKSGFNRRAAVASARLRQLLYVIVFSCVLAMFGIATWISQRILKRWAAKEESFRARDLELSQVLQARVSDLEKAVNEKGVLLRELQHRVKNNLQVVSSLSSLQARKASDPPTREALITIQNRVKSLSLIHESLSFSDSMDEVDFAKYVQGFAQQLVDSYTHGSDSIRLHFEVNAVVGLDQATPCALIINELLSNSLKFAFGESKQGNIWIKFVQQDQDFTLEVRDDGIGLLPGFSLKSAGSLGLQLVTELAAQLNGTVSWSNDGGAVFSVKFRCRQPHHAGRAASELVAASAANQQS